MLKSGNVPFIFLSYAHENQKQVMQLKSELDNQHIAVWVDRIDIRAGTPDWEEEIRQAIRSAYAVVLIASPDAAKSRYVKDELRLAETYKRTVYPLWIVGEQWVDAVPLGWGSSVYIDARGTRYTSGVRGLVNALRAEYSVVQESSKARPSQYNFEPRNPYKGLRPFTREDSGDFFGREVLVQSCIEKIEKILSEDQQNIQHIRLLPFLGSSGSGKSSVVMAGVLPALQSDALLGSSQWHYLQPFTPGVRPIEALALRFTEELPQRSVSSICEDLEATPRGLQILIQTLLQTKKTQVVLIIDQFEELFTQTESEEERQRFIDLIVTAATEPQASLFIILTLRADFYERLMHYRHLYELIEARQVTVLEMEIYELRAAIEKPAALPDVQISFEDGLVGDVLFELRGQIGALPLLQFMLLQLFEKREGHRLMLQAYQEIGGVQGALYRHAQSTYESLRLPEDREMVPGLFTRLVTLGPTDQDITRRRLPLTELHFTNPQQNSYIERVIKVFTDARLLTSNTVLGTRVIEISHEALIRTWPLLQDWIHTAYEDIRLQKTISEDAAAWRRNGELTEYLYIGSKLQKALEWSQRNPPNQNEEQFLYASETAKKTRERREKQRGRRNMLIGAGFIFAIGGLTTELVIQLLKPPQLKKTLTRNLPYILFTDYSASVYSIQWSPDGQLLASVNSEHLVRIWDVHNGNLLFSYKKDQVTTIAWSPDSQSIVSSGGEKFIQIWKVNNGNTQLHYTKDATANNLSTDALAWSPDGHYIASAEVDKSYILQVANMQAFFLQKYPIADLYYILVWSPDSKRLAIGGRGGNIHVQDIHHEKTLLTYEQGSNLTALAWSPDGSYIASSIQHEQTVQIWDTRTGKTSLIYKGHNDQVTGVTWSPDGKYIASSSNDTTVQVWDSKSGDRILLYRGHQGAVQTVTWSPQEQRIASLGEDHTVQLWDMTDGSYLTYAAYNAPIYSLAWSPDSTSIVLGGNSNVVHVIDFHKGNTLFTYQGGNDSLDTIKSVAWSPNGQYIASAYWSSPNVEIREAVNGNLLLTYDGHAGTNAELTGIQSLAWSPDSRFIASASVDGAIQVRGIPHGELHFSCKRSDADFAWAIAWSPDGQYLAGVGGEGKGIYIWDARNGELSFTFPFRAMWQDLSWSPDSRRLVLIHDVTKISVFDIEKRSVLPPYSGHIDEVHAVAWSPDGKYIASGGRDTTTQVWDADTGRTIYTYRGHTYWIETIAWSPNSKYVASAGDDKIVQIWRVL